MSDFWYIMKDFMDECPILAMFVLLIIAGCMIYWIVLCILCPSLILFTIIAFATAFGLWKFCKWMISKNVKSDK